MPHRVIYCAVGYVSLLADLPHESLRKLDDGVIVSLSDETTESLALNVVTPPILYFSRQSYEEAVRGLTDPEVDEALRRRFERWSPSALEHALEWIARGERSALTLTSLAWRSAAGERGRPFEAHFHAGLDLLTSIASTGRYEDMPIPDLLSAAIERDALLVEELGPTSEAQARTKSANALAQELKGHGRGEFARALPYAEPQRGVWVSPVDPAFSRFLKTRGEPGFAWRDGIVASLSVRAIQDFEKRGKKTRILYQDAGELMRDFDELTPAQLNLRFLDLASTDQAGRARQRADYLNICRLDALLLRRALRARAVKEDARMVALLDEQIRADTGVLAAAIAQGGSWLAPGDQADPLPRLRAAESELAQDARVFLSVARLGGDAYLAHRLEAVLAAKEADLARLQAAR